MHRIVAAASNLAEPHYNIVLFQAMCLFAFHTFSRIGEITHSSSTVRHSGGNKITFHNYKHLHNQRPFTLNILPCKVF